MHAEQAYSAGMKKKRVQYTIRNVPETVDEALRKLAVRDGASLNQAALAALKAGAGVEEGVRHHDVDALAGTWVRDEAFDEAQAVFEAIDEELWK